MTNNLIYADFGFGAIFEIANLLDTFLLCIARASNILSQFILQIRNKIEQFCFVIRLVFKS